jgi:uncharacterized membrane protein
MRTLTAGLAFAAGAVIMYTFDPNQGRRRRARVRNELDHLVHVVPRSLRKASADSAQRVHGKLTRLQHLPAAAVEDDVLDARVRAALGRCCSHTSAVRVSSRSGVVELRGPILGDEVGPVLRRIQRVPGVRAITDALEPHDTPEGVASLQGQRHGRPPGIRGSLWPISLRWATGAAGASAALSGLWQGGLRGTGLALAGTAAVVRSATNRPLRVLFGFGAAAETGIDVSKTVTIEAPAHDVFSRFVAFENFPKFMRHVREVRRLDGNRWHWTVEGAGGLKFDWDGIITRLESPTRVAWTSTESAAVRHHGEATFEAISEQTTRLTIRLVYDPPLGAIGHGVAKLLGADPKRELDDDMLRFKSLLETGKATGRAGSVTLADVRPVES